MASVSIQYFRKSAIQNLQSYPRCTNFWWPIIDARATRNEATTEDLLLNPVFRWVFLNRSKKLESFENQISMLETALGVDELQAFHGQLLRDISSHPIENYAHNRLLSAMTEIRAMLRLSSDGYTISLVPRDVGQKTPDFSADKQSQSYLVEVKYIRPPDKLKEYLFRWWQAKKEVNKTISLDLLPHLKFEWSPVESRKELSQAEIVDLKVLFATVLQNPDLSQELAKGRIIIKYLPNRKLPAAIVPIPVKAASSEAKRGEGLFAKLEKILDYAASQTSSSSKNDLRMIFLAINLSPDIQFLWHERFQERLESICQELSDKGIQVVVEEVGYL